MVQNSDLCFGYTDQQNNYFERQIPRQKPFCSLTPERKEQYSSNCQARYLFEETGIFYVCIG